MKEIKFRAWDGETMHYDVVPWRWDFVISLSWHRCERSTGSGILGSGGKEGDFLVPGIAFREIMQFTGLKDKNGKEIYEGDIIQYKSYWVNKRWWSDLKDIPIIDDECKRQRENFSLEKANVRFNDGCFILGYDLDLTHLAKGYKHEFGRSHSCDTENKQWDFEVIGNIYEHKHLLK